MASNRRALAESLTPYKQGLDAYLSGDKGEAKRLWEASQSLPEAQSGLRRLAVEQSGAPQSSGPSKALYVEGLSKFLSGDKQSALQLWRGALMADPNNLEARKGLSRLALTDEE